MQDQGQTRSGPNNATANAAPQQRAARSRTSSKLWSGARQKSANNDQLKKLTDAVNGQLLSTNKNSSQPPRPYPTQRRFAQAFPLGLGLPQLGRCSPLTGSGGRNPQRVAPRPKPTNPSDCGRSQPSRKAVRSKGRCWQLGGYQAATWSSRQIRKTQKDSWQLAFCSGTGGAGKSQDVPCDGPQDED
jgi:hypothetical protein